MHNLAKVPVFLGLPAAAFTCGWQFVRTGHRRWPVPALAGLFQRASIVTGFGWLTALSARALTRAPAASGRKP
jgi:hypothetical protein